jgi:hypothetical protein
MLGLVFHQLAEQQLGVDVAVGVGTVCGLMHMHMIVHWSGLIWPDVLGGG